MELALQCGHGMMALNLSLIQSWGGGTVILSPRDLKPDQLPRHAEEIRRIGGRVLLDPQFYLPHADHARLRSHAYWPANYETQNFWGGKDLRELLQKLLELNSNLGSEAFILPGMYAPSIDDDWLHCQQTTVEEAVRIADGRPLLQTIALGEDAVRSEEQLHDLLEAIESWPVHGYYVVCEHPNGDYLVEDPIWLANQLDLIAGLKLRGGKVIVGYCTHQMLPAALAHADMIASGNWMNVRSFPPEKFQIPPEEEERRNAIWYYTPLALSEYKIPFLDVAAETGVLDLMAPPDEMHSGDARKLFQGVQPSTVGFSRSPDAFRHYLQCLHHQATSAVKETYDATLTAQRHVLDEAEELLDDLKAAGVSGQKRDFTDIVDVNRAAIAVFDTRRGAIMRRRWTNL